jgi:hypothetical protein
VNILINNNNNFLKLDLKTFLRGFVLLITFLISVFLGNLYVQGDQTVYIRTYNGMPDYSFFDAYLFYTFNISSIEIIHFVIVWFASNLGIDKVIFMSGCNTFIAGLIIRIFDKMNVSFTITALFILTNFYLYVIFFAAERLKFGILFFLLCIIYRRRRYLYPILLTTSILSHLQMIILFLCKAFQLLITEIRSIIFTLKLKWSLLLPLPIILVGLLFLQNSIFEKILAYSKADSIFDFLRIMIFFLISIFYARDKIEPVLYFFPLFVAVYFVSGDRVNMIGYIVSLYYCLPYRRGINLGMLITSFYFLYMNIDFVLRIIENGNGFPPR